jgi:hypothetical protein
MAVNDEQESAGTARGRVARGRVARGRVARGRVAPARSRPMAGAYSPLKLPTWM